MARTIEGAEPAGVVRLNRGDAAPALFCLHPGYGLTAEYRALAGRLESVAAVWGIDSPIYAEPEWRAASMEALAREYVARMRRVQPAGPYALLGWSHGGLIAQAMALELERAGETIRFLGLIDVLPAGLHVVPAETVDEREEIAAILHGLDPEMPAAMIDRAVTVAREADALTAAMPPGRLRADLHLWWAAESLERHGGAEAARADWRDATAGRVVEAAPVPASHAGIVCHPVLADSLRAILSASG